MSKYNKRELSLEEFTGGGGAAPASEVKLKNYSRLVSVQIERCPQRVEWTWLL